MTILHRTFTYPALLPRYVTRFSCTGPSCEDNCCTGWSVSIDKKSFNEYKKIKNPILTERFTTKIRRVRSQASEANYGKIELTPPSHECPFMEERLCSIQRELGADKLSNICFSYPRRTRRFGELYEQALTLSCPEAARLALTQADAFDFIEDTIAVRPNDVRIIQKKNSLSLELMNDIRIFCLQLIQTDGFELWQKLAVLGIFCESLTNNILQGNDGEIKSKLNDFYGFVESGKIFEIVADIQPDHSSQVLGFVLNFTKRTANHEDKVWKIISSGLDIGTDANAVSAEKLTANYNTGLIRMKQTMAECPFLLEHYLLNEMFYQLFPFDGTSAFQHYLSIISRFGMLRLMLAAQCSTSDTLPNTAQLVQTVQIFCRVLQHNTDFHMQLDDFHKTHGWNKMENVFRFLPA